MALINLHPLL